MRHLASLLPRLASARLSSDLNCTSYYLQLEESIYITERFDTAGFYKLYPNLFGYSFILCVISDTGLVHFRV